jgi:hypothetical protein
LCHHGKTDMTTKIKRTRSQKAAMWIAYAR